MGFKFIFIGEFVFTCVSRGSDIRIYSVVSFFIMEGKEMFIKSEFLFKLFVFVLSSILVKLENLRNGIEKVGVR